MLHTVESTYANSSWSGFDESGRLVFHYEGAEHAIAPKEVIAWQPDSQSFSPRSEAVVLIDGSILTGLIAVLRDDSIRIQTSQFGLVTLAKTQVAAVLLDASSQKVNELYDRWCRDSTQGDDTIYLRDGQISSGVIKTLGTSALLRLSNTQAVEIEAGTQVTQISVSRIAAIRFSPILYPIEIDPAASAFDFADGTHMAVKAGRSKDKKFEFVTASDVKLLASDTNTCVDQCAGIFADASFGKDWKLVDETDVLETRGQSVWTENRWVYFEKDQQQRPYGLNQMQLRVLPSVRIKVRNHSSWKRIVGDFRVMPVADGETVTSDVLGNRAQVHSNRTLEVLELNVRFVAISDGKLVNLWSRTLAPFSERQAFSVDISKYADFYVLIENSDMFSTPVEVVFERMRFSQ